MADTKYDHTAGQVISQIKLGNVTYEIHDKKAHEKIDNLATTLDSNGIHFEGVTTDNMRDGQTETPTGITSPTHGGVVLDALGREYILVKEGTSNGVWYEFGRGNEFKELAFTSAAELEGKVLIPTTDHTHTYVKTDPKHTVTSADVTVTGAVNNVVTKGLETTTIYALDSKSTATASKATAKTAVDVAKAGTAVSVPNVTASTPVKASKVTTGAAISVPTDASITYLTTGSITGVSGSTKASVATAGTAVNVATVGTAVDVAKAGDEVTVANGIKTTADALTSLSAHSAVYSANDDGVLPTLAPVGTLGDAAATAAADHTRLFIASVDNATETLNLTVAVDWASGSLATRTAVNDLASTSVTGNTTAVATELATTKVVPAVANGTVAPAVANGTITPYTFNDVTVPVAAATATNVVTGASATATDGTAIVAATAVKADVLPVTATTEVDASNVTLGEALSIVPAVGNGTITPYEFADITVPVAAEGIGVTVVTGLADGVTSVVTGLGNVTGTGTATVVIADHSTDSVATSTPSATTTATATISKKAQA